jgi:kynurenine formamidase
MVQKLQTNSMKFPYKIIDLTHTLDASAPGWNDRCGFTMDRALDYQQCTTEVKFRAHKITMTAGMGTHMDAPVHCIPGGHSIDDLSLEDLIVPCVMIDVSRSVGENENYRFSTVALEAFEKLYGTISAGSLVIVNTGWHRFWGDAEQYRNNYQFPSISIEAAQLLLERGVVGLGIDTFSADRPVDEFCVHGAFLGAGKYLVENIKDAHLLPPLGSFVGVFPLKLKGGSESPIRLVSFVPENY